MTNLLISLTLFLFPHRYLYDSSHRETFESAHSVILSVFASRAQRLQRHTESLTPHYRSGRVNSHADSSGTIHKDVENLDPVMKMVPFYAHCLLEVSYPTREGFIVPRRILSYWFEKLTKLPT